MQSILDEGLTDERRIRVSQNNTSFFAFLVHDCFMIGMSLQLLSLMVFVIAVVVIDGFVIAVFVIVIDCVVIDGCVCAEFVMGRCVPHDMFSICIYVFIIVLFLLFLSVCVCCEGLSWWRFVPHYMIIIIFYLLL